MSRTPTPWPALSSAQDSVQDSGIVNVSRVSILLMMREGPDLAPVARALSDSGLLSIPASTPAAALALNYLPRFAIIETGGPGALEFLRRGTSPPTDRVAGGGGGGRAPAAAARAAGARATLHRPLSAPDVTVLVDRFRKHDELLTRSRELFERNEANALVSTTARVTAAICHEIRNPLQSVRLNVQILQDDSARERRPLSFQDRAEILGDIESALRRIDSIVTSLSALAKGERPALARIDLGDVARDALASVRGDASPVELALQPGVEGLAERGLLRQVIVNLLENALDAVRRCAEPKVLVRVYATAGEARVSIRDNGPGVPADLRDRIFEPFFSTKGSGGTGLGLAIARQAVASMGGALTLSGEDPPGACFRIRVRR